MRSCPLTKSPGHRLSGNKAPSPQGDKGKKSMEIDEASIGKLADSLAMDNLVLGHILGIPYTTTTGDSVQSSNARTVPNARSDESMENDDYSLENAEDQDYPANDSNETFRRDKFEDDIQVVDTLVPAPKRKQIRKNKNRSSGHGVSRQGGNHGRCRHRKGPPGPSRAIPD